MIGIPEIVAGNAFLAGGRERIALNIEGAGSSCGLLQQRANRVAHAFAGLGVRAGWFRTGDTGSIDEQGYLTLSGRARDMIISGGMNVYPREIEDLLAMLPGVADVAVVGVPDPKRGEVPVAIVVAPGAEASLERAVHGACEALSSFKRSKSVLLRAEALPRTPTGKVLKRELRPWAEQVLSQRR